MTIDAASATGAALDHVVSLGHRSVVYVGGDESSMTERGRWEALHAAAEKRGISSQRIGTHHASYQEGGAAADAVLATNATAAFFRNDLLAIGTLQRFEERGIRVPDQISVVGCDDIFGASFCHPPLTTIAAPVEQAGRMAMGMLLDRIERIWTTLARPLPRPFGTGTPGKLRPGLSARAHRPGRSRGAPATERRSRCVTLST